MLIFTTEYNVGAIDKGRKGRYIVKIMINI